MNKRDHSDHRGVHLSFASTLALAISCVTPAVAFAAPGAAAQSAPSGPAAANPPTTTATSETASETQQSLGDIVVTARKRSEALKDVPLSVQALSGQTLEAARINDLFELQKAAPGLTFFQNLDRSYSQIFIRGMTNVPPVYDTTRELASTFVDGVYFSGTQTALNIDDLERVEVVKGPQSALYGRSTFSGAVNFITRKPGNTFHARLSGTAAQDDLYELSGAVEGPIARDVLAARLYGRYRSFGGQYRNALDGSRVGKEEDRVVGGAVTFTPASSVRLGLTASYSESDDGPAASQLLGRKPTHNCQPYPTTFTFFCGKLDYTGGRDGVRLNNTLPTFKTVIPGAELGFHRKFFFGTGTADIDLPGNFLLSYLGGYTSERSHQVKDFDRTDVPTYFDSVRIRINAQSHELRLSSPADHRLRGLVGLFYYKLDFQTISNFIYGQYFGALAGTVTPNNFNTRRIENEAVFGSLTFDITDQLNISAEGRYQDDKLRNTLVTGVAFKASTKSFLPRVILTYKPNRDLTLYASFAKGNKPEAINQTIYALSPANQAIVATKFDISPTAREETIQNYEAGIKGNFAGNRGYFALSGFYARWNDQQQVQTFTNDFNGNGAIDTIAPDTAREFLSSITTNTGRLKVYGFEAEVQYRPTTSLSLGANAAYSRGDYLSGFDANRLRFSGNGNLAGARLTEAPAFQGAANVSYSRPVSNRATVFGRIDLSYLGRIYSDQLLTTWAGPATRVNANVGVRFGAVSATLFAKNLFDDQTLQSIRQQGDSATDPFTFASRAYEAVLPLRRQIGVTLAFRY